MDNLTESGSPQDLFAFRINYNIVEPDMGGTALFNGNISETFWRTASDNVLRKYSYTYDHMNRLTDAIYQKPDSAVPIPNSYNEHIRYDQNGNITDLSRTGGLDSADMALNIDELVYKYSDKSNKLLTVFDIENSTQGFSDDSDGTDDAEDDYDYDAMGNLIMDQNKKIESISYNHLNLPQRIRFSTEGTNEITYLYDAFGRKKDKIVTRTDGEEFERIHTHYMGGFQYAEGKLQFFPTAQGYVRVVDDNYYYVFNMTDHLGNIRLSYTHDALEDKLEIIEENHYYPYGLKHQNYNIDKLDYVEGDNGVILASASALEFKYKFNGIEFQEELGLNLYDMDFRDYDPAIARWTGIDPITHHSMSPYMAFDGNPVYWADPSGADSAPNQWLLGNDGWVHVDGSNFVNVWGSGDSETISAGDAIELLNASFGGDAGNVSVSAATPRPSSFNFTSIGNNWQQAAVKNIHFIIALVDVNNAEAYVKYSINFPQAVLFGLPKNLKTGDTNIDSKMAAIISANVLHETMSETANKFAEPNATRMQVEQFFRARLAHNYQLSIPGGRVNFNSMNYTGTATQYKSSW